MTSLPALLTAFVAGGAVAVLLAEARTWVHVMAWAVVLVAAAALGAVLGGSAQVEIGALLAGLFVTYAVLRFWAAGQH
jgi:hypothetical protein